MLTTTFKLLRKHDACKDRYKVLRKALKGRKDNKPITLIEILDSNGLADAIWALRAVPDEQAAERDRLARLFACWCVRQVWRFLDDERSRSAVEVAERFAVGKDTLDKLEISRNESLIVVSEYTHLNYYAYAALAAANVTYSKSSEYVLSAVDAVDSVAYYSSISSASSAAYSSAAYAAARDAQAAKFREMFG